MRLGYELGYISNPTKPSDLRRPDHSPSKPLSDLERLYIRTFGIPDTVKQQQARAVFPIISKLSFSSVLDIGCAQGHYSIRIARKYPNVRVKGIDINDEKLDQAQRLKEMFGLKNLTFEKMDLCNNPLAEKYDLVLLLQVIEHLSDDRATLKKIREVMSDDACLIITGPNSQSPLISWSKRYVDVE